uniref:Uncharacterized protein n=1 Tax=Chromera velia CCMP2878 TaxID=1169474 RepID=A0A0G4H1B5_9ALVE|eukprot:Cvel_24283.t1-p1 / transcript=Cvel_24283.t1 / gene=Cvel_24283 / organism=Chromera_velia_CCMP2878 / gene_product=hypothetical protein / transcript_product=hypothetical protein / location=Cvel_scaffold2605:13347-14535(-) / protein_length=276 / sequence_SO=supercontig / SO=protein_coding / is_pseudo=false
MIVESEKNRLRRARSFGAQFALAILFYASGLSESFVVPRVTSLSFVAQRSWRLLVPLVAGWLLFVWPVIWICREFYNEGRPLGGGEWNFVTGLSQFFQVIGQSGTLHLCFLAVLFVFGLMNHAFFRFVSRRQVGDSAPRSEKRCATVGRGVTGLTLVSLFSVGVVAGCGYEPAMLLLALPHFCTVGCVWVQCWIRERPVPNWFSPAVLVLNVGVSIGLANVGFPGVQWLHMVANFNLFYMQGFIDGEFRSENESLFGDGSLLGKRCSWLWKRVSDL